MRQVQDLYDRDFNLWTRETAAALRAHRLAELDLEHLAEEIEDMGKRDKRELRGRITQILEHLLELRLAKSLILDYNRGPWEGSIARQRTEINGLLQESPSLQRLITPEFLEECYRDAAKVVATEYKVKPPKQSPFLKEDVL